MKCTTDLKREQSSPGNDSAPSLATGTGTALLTPEQLEYARIMALFDSDLGKRAICVIKSSAQREFLVEQPDIRQQALGTLVRKLDHYNDEDLQLSELFHFTEMEQSALPVEFLRSALRDRVGNPNKVLQFCAAFPAARREVDEVVRSQLLSQLGGWDCRGLDVSDLLASHSNKRALIADPGLRAAAAELFVSTAVEEMKMNQHNRDYQRDCRFDVLQHLKAVGIVSDHEVVTARQNALNDALEKRRGARALQRLIHVADAPVAPLTPSQRRSHLKRLAHGLYIKPRHSYSYGPDGNPVPVLLQAWPLSKVEKAAVIEKALAFQSQPWDVVGDDYLFAWRKLLKLSWRNLRGCVQRLVTSPVCEEEVPWWKMAELLSRLPRDFFAGSNLGRLIAERAVRSLIDLPPREADDISRALAAVLPREEREAAIQQAIDRAMAEGKRHRAFMLEDLFRRGRNDIW